VEISSARQAQVFLGMVLCGALCTLIFDIFRAIRRFKKTSGGIIVFQDLVFWAIELVVVYMVAFRLNYAGVRGYLVIALVIGSVLYFVTLSEHVISFLCKIMDCVCKIVNRVISPFMIFAKWLVKPWVSLYEFAKKKISIVKVRIGREFCNIYSKIREKAKSFFSTKSKKKEQMNVETETNLADL